MHLRHNHGFFLLVCVFFLLTCGAEQAAAAPPSASNEDEQRVVITFANKADASLVKGKIKRQNKRISALTATMTTKEIEKLKKHRSIQSIEPDIQLQASVQTANWGVAAVQAQTVWDQGYTGNGIKVAVLDSGISTSHDDLDVAGGASFVDYTSSYEDDYGHGTHVAGIIGAKHNEIGTVGIAPDASLYAVKVLDATGKGYLSDVLAGIDWAVEHQMDIMNLSMTTSIDSPALHNAVDQAYAQGVLIVAAAGNTGNASGSGTTIQYPARYSSVIAVGAVDPANQRAPFSATGDELEIVAPGVGIQSTHLNQGYASLSGTSMAAPFAAAELALLKQGNPTLNPAELRALLDRETVDLGPAGRDSAYGYGVIRLSANMVVAPSVDAPEPAVTQDVYDSVTQQMDFQEALLFAATVPRDPTNLQPGTGVRANPALITTPTPTLTWTFSDADPGDKQSAYQVVIYNHDFSAVVHDTDWKPSAFSSFTVPAGKLYPGSSYAWSVRVKDNAGNVSIFSVMSYIRINSKPNEPLNLLPGPGSSAAPAVIVGTTPTLTWTFSDADAGDSQSAYQLVMYDGAVTTVIWNTAWITDNVSSFVVPADLLVPGAKYAWRVRVRDSVGESSEFSIMNYIRINSQPSLVLLAPSAGQTISDPTLTFQWNYSDTEGQPQARYHIQGSRDGWLTTEYDSTALASATTTHLVSGLASGTWEFRLMVSDGLEPSVPVYRTVVVAPSDFEPNDTPAQAFSISYNQHYNSKIQSATDVDVFTYTATSSDVDRFRLTVPSGVNYDVYIYDASMNLLASGSRPAGSAENVLYDVTAGQTYYIQIVGVNQDFSTDFSYSFILSKLALQFKTDYQYDANGNIVSKITNKIN